MSESDASFDVSEIFSDKKSDNELNSNLKLDSMILEDDDDSDDNLVDDKSQLSSKHYLDEAESLNVSQL
jgi:hypothetical protein